MCAVFSCSRVSPWCLNTASTRIFSEYRPSHSLAGTGPGPVFVLWVFIWYDATLVRSRELRNSKRMLKRFCHQSGPNNWWILSVMTNLSNILTWGGWPRGDGSSTQTRPLTGHVQEYKLAGSGVFKALSRLHYQNLGLGCRVFKSRCRCFGCPFLIRRYVRYNWWWLLLNKFLRNLVLYGTPMFCVLRSVFCRTCWYVA